METRIFHLHALSALHVGTGQGVGVVDLPIARAKATNLPIVAGSALKGVLRDEAESQFNLPEATRKQDIQTLFGPLNTDASHAGALAFGDAQLLILPIRSFAGTVAYATCPYILRQYQRDTGCQNMSIPNVTGDSARTTQDSLLFVTGTKIALEDLDIEAHKTETVENWANTIASQLYPESVAQFEQWRQEFVKRFVILPDDTFSFLADTATEVRTRIRIDRNTRIVTPGALWTEENLPAETVLWGVVGVSASRNTKNKDNRAAVELAALLPTQKELMLQIGGKHTVGRGLCRLLLSQQPQA